MEPTETRPGDADLRAEARLFAIYLVSRPAPPQLVERYLGASRRLAGPIAGPDAAVVRFVRRRSWSLPYLDAASGLLRPDGLLRRKLLLAAAILEAAPDFADRFLPRHRRPGRLALEAAVLGLAAVAKAAVGSLLYPLAAGFRR